MNNKNYKKTRIVIDLLVLGALLVFMAGNVALAANSATVTATVTLQNISVTVAPGTVAYGTIAASGYTTTLSGGVSGQQTATNAGNVAESFNIKGQNSSAWTLSGTAVGADTYMEKFCVATCGTNASPTNFTALTTSYASLGTNIGTSGTKVFDLAIYTPSSSATFTQQSVDVTVQAVSYP